LARNNICFSYCGLTVRRQGGQIEVRGVIDIDTLVMDAVGTMAGGP